MGSEWVLNEFAVLILNKKSCDQGNHQTPGENYILPFKKYIYFFLDFLTIGTYYPSIIKDLFRLLADVFQPNKESSISRIPGRVRG
mgnify:CR=1 FL=1